MGKDQRPAVKPGEWLNMMQVDTFPDANARPGMLGRNLYRSMGIGAAEDYGIVKYRGQFCAVRREAYISGQASRYLVLSIHRKRTDAEDAARLAWREYLAGLSVTEIMARPDWIAAEAVYLEPDHV